MFCPQEVEKEQQNQTGSSNKSFNHSSNSYFCPRYFLRLSSTSPTKEDEELRRLKCLRLLALVFSYL